MLSAEDQSIQDCLASYVVSLGEPDAHLNDGKDFLGETSVLGQFSQERLQIYRQSFAGRVFLHLPKLALRPLCRALGDDFMVELAARYFHSNPPGSWTSQDHQKDHDSRNPSCMMAALQDLPDFIRKNSPNEYGLLIGGMAALTLIRWQLLQGPDPSDPLSKPVQQTQIPPSRWVMTPLHHLFIPEGNIDLFSAWIRCEEDSQTEIPLKYDFDEHINKEPTGVLLVKVTPSRLVSLEVKAPYFDFCRRLTAGRDLYEAAAEMSSANIGNQDKNPVDPQKFVEFLRQLKQMKVLVQQ